MIYRTLGTTGLKLSHISFGGSSLGGVFHPIDEKRAEEAVYVAIENGINFIDVSPYYGYYRAETVLGRALKSIPRDQYYLSTKVGRYGANGVNTFDYSGKRAQTSVYESMERLGIDFIDIINVHDLEFSDLNQVVEETLPALVELRDEGVVGFVGITGLPLINFKKVIDRVPPGTVNSILTFCHYTLQDQTLLDYLDYFEKHQVGIVNASPIAMGLLSERGTPDWHPASEKLKATCRKAAEFCHSKNIRIEQLAMRFSVGNPRITTTLTGTSNPDNIRMNIAWANGDLNEPMVAEVMEILQPVMNETWENC
ncbi:MAG: aldo/keto reductase [Bacteroidales bacterium]|nr:aldo/keto reductase [Bacteroidales bacterium]